MQVLERGLQPRKVLDWCGVDAVNNISRLRPFSKQPSARSTRRNDHSGTDAQIRQQPLQVIVDRKAHDAELADHVPGSAYHVGKTLRIVGPLDQRYVDSHLLAVAYHCDRRLFANLVSEQGSSELLGVAYRFAADGDDDLAGLQSRTLRR